MYIRTKDNVYDLENDDIVKIDGKYKECYVQKDTGDTCFKDIEILNQSENIEELCDEFIVECFNKSYHAISEIGYDELKHNTQTLSPTDTIYGAIWTDKGLIYVAKMNDKGELELI